MAEVHTVHLVGQWGFITGAEGAISALILLNKASHFGEAQIIFKSSLLSE